MPNDHAKSLIIIGAGPAGLAAALYAAREGMKPLIFDKGVVGGMAALTEKVDNYPGFDEGIGGLELADRLLRHATRFGAKVETGIAVTGLGLSAGNVIVRTDQDDYQAESVIVATGSTYKYLGVPGESNMIGRGVHFCATCDAPLYRGKQVAVVGGGNSAVQETLFIAKFAAHVTLFVRSDALKATQVLIEQLELLDNVSIHYETQVREIRNDGAKVTGLHTVSKSGHESDYRTDAVFVFIGLNANTQAFEDSLELDDRGFIVTRPDFATNLPGVFAAGDVRTGSTWQIASAIGEGVSSALSVRSYLDIKHHLARKAMTDVRKRPARA
jgi:thioredoxin reductase (NADPH)